MAVLITQEEYNALLTTTARNLRGTIMDGNNISKSNKLVGWLDMKGRMRSQAGGERVQVPLLYELNSTVDTYRGYGQFDTTPQEGITSAFFTWAQAGAMTTINGIERRSNRSVSRLRDLLAAKLKQTEMSCTEYHNNCIVAGRLASGATGNLNQFVPRVGRIDPGAQNVLPLPALIDANPARSVSIGGHNGATETWWRNQADASTATTYSGFKRELNHMYMMCGRGIGGHPDIMLSDQLIFEVYMASLHTLERYQVTDPRVLNVLGGARDSQFMFRGATWIWDEIVPDVGTSTSNPVDGIGTVEQSGAHSTCFFINSEFMEFIYDPSANWTQGPFMTPYGQDSSGAATIWQGALCVNNRRKHGVIYDLDNSIAA